MRSNYSLIKVHFYHNFNLNGKANPMIIIAADIWVFPPAASCSWFADDVSLFNSTTHQSTSNFCVLFEFLCTELVLMYSLFWGPLNCWKL